MMRLAALLGLVFAFASATPDAVALARSKGTKVAEPLPGETFDFVYDGADVRDKKRAYEGRIFVHAKAKAEITKGKAVPLLVFFHGLNKDKIRFRWMGGGNEGDVRRIVSDLIDAGKIAPVIVAGPSSIVPEAVEKGSSFPVFDAEKFLGQVASELGKQTGGGKVDQARIAVSGHSGAGCSPEGGIVSALRGTTTPLAVISIDTCMSVGLAKSLAKAEKTTHVVVTWQTVSWDREFAAFKRVFADQQKATPPDAGVLRELDALPALPRAHDATVGQTFEKYLPRLFAPAP